MNKFKLICPFAKIRGGVFRLAFSMLFAVLALSLISCDGLFGDDDDDDYGGGDEIRTASLSDLPQNISLELKWSWTENGQTSDLDKLTYIKNGDNWLIEGTTQKKDEEEDAGSKSVKIYIKKVQGGWIEYFSNAESKFATYQTEPNKTLDDCLGMLYLNIFFTNTGIYASDKTSRTETVAGQKCDVYEWSAAYLDKAASYTYCVNKDGFVLKWKVSAKDGGQSAGWTYEVTKWDTTNTSFGKIEFAEANGAQV